MPFKYLQNNEKTATDSHLTAIITDYTGIGLEISTQSKVYFTLPL